MDYHNANMEFAHKWNKYLDNISLEGRLANYENQFQLNVIEVTHARNREVLRIQRIEDEFTAIEVQKSRHRFVYFSLDTQAGLNLWNKYFGTPENEIASRDRAQKNIEQKVKDFK